MVTQVKLTEFSDLITRYTADFVGREWLVEQVDALLDDPDCRFVVLTGGPGVGKTAFMAHLAATHPAWPRYFIRRDSKDLLRPGDANTFLLTVGGQLATLFPQLFHPENLEVVVRQRVGSVEEGGEVTGARIEELRASPFYRVALLVGQEIWRVAGKATAVEIGRLVSEPRSMQMQDLQYLGLLDPARLLAREDPEARIVVLVDALDELRYSPAEPDILRALRELPEVPPNLHFVVSSRPEVFLGRLLSRNDACELPLNVTGASNWADLRTYAEGALSDDGLRSVLAKEGLSLGTFVEGLLGKAAGNFLYLRSVLNGILEALEDTARQHRLRQLLHMEELPDNLDALYNYFLAAIVDWAERRGFGEDAWRKYLKPLLGALAVAQEPLSEEQLIAFTGLELEDILDLLRELRQFVETVDDGQAAYRIYHASFAEHLLDSEHNREYWIDEQGVHHYIADHYLDGWGGLKADLPKLQDPEKQDLNDGYGLRHLAAHLNRSRQSDTLYMLVECKVWRDVKKTTLGSDKSFHVDLERAIRCASDQGVRGLPRVAAYRLLQGTLGSLATNVPTRLLRLMTKLGWGERSEEYASLVVDPRRRALAWIDTAWGWLDMDLDRVKVALHLALRAVEQVEDVLGKANLLSLLAECQARAGEKEAAIQTLAAVRKVAVQIEADQPSGFCNKTKVLSQLGKTEAIVGETESSLQTIAEALRMAEQVEPFPYLRGEAFHAVAHAQAFVGERSAALSTAGRIQSSTWKIEALSDVAYFQVLMGKIESARQTLVVALTVAEQNENTWQDSRILRTLAGLHALVGDVTTALTTAEQIHAAEEKAEALYRVAQACAWTGEIGAALSTAERIEDVSWRDMALTVIIEAQAEQGKIAAALETVKQIENGEQKAEALCSVAEGYREAEEFEAARKTTLLVLRAMEGTGGALWKAIALNTVARTQVHSGEAKAAGRTLAMTLLAANQLLDAWEKAHVLNEMAQIQMLAGEVKAAQRFLAEAQALIERIDGEHDTAEAASAIAQTQAVAGEIEAALMTSEHVADNWRRNSVLNEVVVALAQVGKIGQARRVLAVAQVTVEEIEHAHLRLSAMSKLADSLAQIGEFAEAQAVVDGIKHDVMLDGLSDESKAARIDAIESPLIALVRAQLQAGEEAAAMATTERIETPRWKVEALSDVACFQASIGKPEAGRESLAMAVATAECIEDTLDRAYALGAVGGALAELGEVEAALATLARIEDSAERTYILYKVAQAQAKAGMLAAAQATVERIMNDRYLGVGCDYRVRALSTMAQAQAERGDMLAALTTAERIEDGWARIDALSSLAQVMTSLRRISSDTRVQWLHTAFSNAGRGGRDNVWICLAGFAQLFQAMGILEETLDQIEMVERWWT